MNPSKHITYGIVGWIIAIIMGTIATLNYLSAPTDELEGRVSKVEITQTLQGQEHILYRDTVIPKLDKLDKVSEDVAWIKGALENIGIKAPKSLNLITP